MANIKPEATTTKSWTATVTGLRAKGFFTPGPYVLFSSGATLICPGMSVSVGCHLEDNGDTGYDIVWEASYGMWPFGTTVELKRVLYLTWDDVAYGDGSAGDDTLGTVVLTTSADFEWTAADEIMPVRYPSSCTPILGGSQELPDFCGETAGLYGMEDCSPDASGSFDDPVRTVVTAEPTGDIAWDLSYAGSSEASGTVSNTLDITAEGVSAAIATSLAGPHVVVVYGSALDFGTASVDADHCDYGDVGSGSCDNGTGSLPDPGQHWEVDWSGLSATLNVQSAAGEGGAGTPPWLSVVGEIPDHSIRYPFSFPDNPDETFVVENNETLNVWDDENLEWVAGSPEGYGDFSVVPSVPGPGHDSITVDYRGRSYIHLPATPSGDPPTYYCEGFFSWYGGGVPIFRGILVDDCAAEHPDYPGYHVHALRIKKSDLANHDLPYFDEEEPDTNPGYGDWRLPLSLVDWDWSAFTIAIDDDKILFAVDDASMFTGTSCTVGVSAGKLSITGVAAGAEAEGDYSGELPADRPWLSHFRFVRLYWSAEDDGDTLRVWLGNKYWDLVYDSLSAYSEIDLCKPHGTAAGSFGATQQSWLNYGFPESQGDGIGAENSLLLGDCGFQAGRSYFSESDWYWGVDEVQTLKFSGMTAGKDYLIEKFQGVVKDHAYLCTRGDWGWAVDRDEDVIQKVKAGYEVSPEENKWVHSVEVGWWVIVDGKPAAEITGQHWRQSVDSSVSLPCGRDRYCPAIEDLEVYPSPPAGGAISITPAAQDPGYLNNDRSIRHLGNAWNTKGAKYSLFSGGTAIGGQARPDAVRLPFSGGFAKGSPFTINVVKRTGHTVQGVVFSGNDYAAAQSVEITYPGGSASDTTDDVGAFEIDIPTQPLEPNVVPNAAGGGSGPSDGKLVRTCCGSTSGSVPIRLRRKTFCGIVLGGGGGDGDTLKYCPATGGLIYR